MVGKTGQISKIPLPTGAGRDSSGPCSHSFHSSQNPGEAWQLAAKCAFGNRDGMRYPSPSFPPLSLLRAGVRIAGA